MLWHNADTLRAHGEAFRQLAREFPDDVLMTGMAVGYWAGPADDPSYRFAFGTKTRPADLPDSVCPVIGDWSELDQFLEEFPSLAFPRAVDGVRAARAAHPERYVLVGWGHFFHQRLAYLRGIESLLYDFYDAETELRTIMDRLLELYGVWAARAAEAGADGVWAGDDLGTQRSLFMRPETFRRLYAPYYRALADVLHGNGLDFWLHTCGNVTDLMEDLIGCGVDAVHPIQAGTMDDRATARTYGGRIAFWVGMDVQQVLPFGTEDEVRSHVGERIETFNRADGGLIIAAGNAILPDTPMRNMRAYLETVSGLRP